jgi:hypothetical protein
MKLFKNLLAGVLFTTVTTATVSALAQSGQSLPFIGAGQDNAYNGYLQIAPGGTYNFGAANLAYAKGSYVTNVPTPVTNAANGLVINTYVSQVLPTYVTNANGIADVTLWANRDGTPPVANIAADINGVSALFNNTVTFNFAAGPTPNGLVANQAQNLWSFTMTGNGTNDVVLATNVPPSLLQGQRKLRLISVTESGGGTNGQVVNVWFDGYKAAPAE